MKKIIIFFLFSTPIVAKPSAMAFLNDTKGITFRASSFLNNLVAYPQTSTLGTTPLLVGIRSNQSQFYCTPVGLSTIGCSFSNFKYGIYATFTDNTKTVTVDYGTFSNNYKGTYLSGAVLTPTIIRSNYAVMQYPAASVTNSAYGIYLDACTSYKIEQNDFTSFGGTIGSGVNNFGVIVSRSGTNVNTIYRNTIENLWTGIEARLTNSNINALNLNDAGLQLRCNVFNTIQRSNMAVTSGQMDYNQGYVGDPAGNYFSHNHITPGINDYFNYSGAFGKRINYVCNTGFNYIPESGWYSPYPAIGLVVPGSPDPYNSSTECLSTFSGFHMTIPIDQLQTNIKNNLVNLAAQKLLLANGDSPALYAAINNTSISAGALKNTLMAQSPYLSDAVLIAMLTRSSALPPGNIKDIIIANSPLTQAVKDVLNTISLPNGIRNQINAAQTGTSARQTVENKILYYQYYISLAKNDIIRNIVNDSTKQDYQTDTVIFRIKQDENIDFVGYTKEVLADSYTSKGQYTQADSVIALIDLNPDKHNVAKLKKVNKLLKQSGQTSAEALITDSSIKAQVDDVAADNSTEGYETAMGILQSVFSQPYQELIDDLIPSSMHEYTPMNNAIPAEPIKTIGIYPNPNNGNMQLDYTLVDGETGILKIIDVTGKLVASYVLESNKTNIAISEAALQNGIYFYQVIVNGETVNADKLVIIKN